MNSEFIGSIVGIPAETGASLAAVTSFRIGGPAELVLRPESAEQLMRCTEAAERFGMPYFVLGNGTNVLADDEGYDGLVIKTCGLCDISVSEESCELEAGCGASLAKLAVRAADAGLTGLEFAHGIPGSLGGAVAMNAGAYGGAMENVIIESLCLLPGGTRLLSAAAHGYGYRRSFYTENPGAVALSGRIRLEKGERNEIRARMNELMSRRKAAQPLDLPSAGSVFKRPEGHFAGKLIEDCGLKGFRIGGAAVSEKHAGFIVNLGGATADDVRRLILHIREAVLKCFGVRLECEIRRLSSRGNEPL